MSSSSANHARPLHYLQSRKAIPPMGLVALRIAVMVTKWDQRAKTRRALNRLSDSDLRDVGISRGEAYTESRRPFWQD